MKKIFSFIFVLAIMLTASFIGMGKAYAWPKTLTAYDSGGANGINYFNVKQSGYGNAYCMQKGEDGPGKSGYAITFSQEITNGPRAYIVNAGKSRSVTAKALWIYNHSVNSKYCKAYSSSKSEYKAAKALADAAKKAGSSYTPVPKIVSVTTPTMTKSGSYYTSQKLTVKTNNVKSWSVSYSGAPSGTTTINKTASTFQIRVPVNNVTKTVSFTVKVTGAKTKYYSAAWYTRKNRQDMLVTKPTTVTPYKNVSAKVTFQKCHKIGSTYYGPNGKVISEKDYLKSSCVTVCKKDPVTGKYVDKSRNGYTSETAAYLKSCFPCGKHGDKYVDANGKLGTLKDYAKTCATPCSTTKDKFGYFYDKDYNNYTSATAAFLKSCAYCGTYNGKYYGKNGNELPSKEAQNAECVGVCMYKDGKYYGPTGNVLTYEQYLASSCVSPCQKDPVTGKYIDKDKKAYNSDTDANYMKSCNPYCAIQDGKYYDSNHKPVTQEEYKASCFPLCGIKDGKYYDKNRNPVSYEEYVHSCVPQEPVPEPTKAVDTELIRYEKNFHYTIKHEVPYRTSLDYFKSYVFTDVLEEPLQIKSAADVKIMQLDKATNEEKDWTDMFDIKLDGQKITASLKEKYLNDKDFYGTFNNEKAISKEYSYILTVSLKDQAETKYNMDKYKVGDYYRIPDTANIAVVNQEGQTDSRDTNKVEVEYRLNPLPIKSVSGFNQTPSYEQGIKYSYIINHQVYDYKGNQRYKSFEFKDEFEEPIEIKSKSDLTIKNESGLDVTSWFDINVKGQKLTAKLKDEYNSDGFYGHTYSFNINVNLKQGYNLSGYLKDNVYKIPNYATVTTDGNKTEKTNVVEVTVDKKVVPKIKVPNTASPVQIAVIAAGVAIIISGVYAILEKYKLVPSIGEMTKKAETPKVAEETAIKETPVKKQTTRKTTPVKKQTTRKTTPKTTKKTTKK